MMVVIFVNLQLLLLNRKSYHSLPHSNEDNCHIDQFELSVDSYDWNIEYEHEKIVKFSYKYYGSIFYLNLIGVKLVYEVFIFMAISAIM